MYEINGEVLQTIANYLQTKPYREVFQLIEMLKQAKPIEVEEKEAE